MVERVYEQRPPFDVPTGAMADPIAEIGPRARPRLRPRSLDQPFAWKELALVAALSLVVGFAQGARSVIGDGTAAVSAGPKVSVTAGSLERDAIRGPLWRPVGSTAKRPRTVLRPVLWRPAGSDVELSGPVGARAIERAPRRSGVVR